MAKIYIIIAKTVVQKLTFCEVFSFFKESAIQE